MADSKSTAKTTASKPTKTDAGQAQVAAKFDKANQRGYFGTVADETPNENYTLAGQASGAPTPESSR